MDLPRGFSPPGILQWPLLGITPKCAKVLARQKCLGSRWSKPCFFCIGGRWLELPVLLVLFLWKKKRCWKDKTMRDFCRFLKCHWYLHNYLQIYIDSCLELVANHCLINKKPFQHIAFSNHVVVPCQIESKHKAGWLLLLELFEKNGYFSVKELQYTTSFSAVSYQFFFSKGVTHLET